MGGQSDGIRHVRLRTGTEVPLVLLESVWIVLEGLVVSDYAAFAQLVQYCWDPSSRPLGEYSQLLEDLGLVQADGELHEGVKEIVIAASAGEGLQVRMVDPMPRLY